MKTIHTSKRVFLFSLLAGLALTAGTSALQAARATLPSDAEIQKAVENAYKLAKQTTGGKNADYIPYLAKVPSGLIGIAVATADGKVFTAGDTDYGFAIESVSKPFTLALVLEQGNAAHVIDKIGLEPTGLPFNSVMAVELHQGPVNPLVNAGAMASVGLVKASSAADKWKKIYNNLNDFAGEKLVYNEEVYKSEADTNQHNRGIAELLQSYGHLDADPIETCDVYTKQCSVNVTAKQLAIMGATLANNGVNPITKKRLLDEKHVPHVLAVMLMAGFYDESGMWAWQSGLPAKTGVGGGIVAIVPGQLAIVGFAPPLDEAGNSVRGAKAIQSIIDELDLSLFTPVRK